jgi:hypothetical protein
MKGIKNMAYWKAKHAASEKSPAKVSDAALVDAQAKLNKTELDFREPGWATAARGAHEGAKKVIKKAADAVGGGDPSADAAQAANVQDIVEKTGNLE